MQGHFFSSPYNYLITNQINDKQKSLDAASQSYANPTFECFILLSGPICRKTLLF